MDWAKRTDSYINAIDNPYHSHRISVLQSMIPNWVFKQNSNIFDFGCGEGVFIALFAQQGVYVTGCDIEKKMIDAAHVRLKNNDVDEQFWKLQVGGVESFQTIPDSSQDGVIAFNVLAYLTKEEEVEFYSQVKRVVRKGGFLLASHSNRLFDLFSLNSYTINFFNDFLVDDEYRSDVKNLLTFHDHPKGDKRNPLPVRENPLNYRFKLSDYGFKEIQQEFINKHEAPPPILDKQHFPGTLDQPDEEKWKLLFTCSTFASLAIRT